MLLFLLKGLESILNRLNSFCVKGEMNKVTGEMNKVTGEMNKVSADELNNIVRQKYDEKNNKQLLFSKWLQEEVPDLPRRAKWAAEHCEYEVEFETPTDFSELTVDGILLNDYLVQNVFPGCSIKFSKREDYSTNDDLYFLVVRWSSSREDSSNEDLSDYE
jgi:hypothetical protein